MMLARRAKMMLARRAISSGFPSSRIRDRGFASSEIVKYRAVSSEIVKYRRVASDIVKVGGSAASDSGSEGESEILGWYKVMKKVVSRFVYVMMKRRCEESRRCAKRLLGFMSVSETLRQRCILYGEGKDYSSTVYFPKNLDQVCSDFSKAYTPFLLAASLAVFGGVFTVANYVYESREEDRKFAAVNDDLFKLEKLVINQGDMLEAQIRGQEEEASMKVKKEISLVKDELMNEIGLVRVEVKVIGATEDLKKKKN